MRITFSLFIIGIICLRVKIYAEEQSQGQAIQIVDLSNHSLQLQLDDLKSILQADDIKDRHVVVVSIAGAFRQGKSFLMNFFIRYLNAQYKDHAVTDWLGENINSTTLGGFRWRGGRKRETVGIWMWSKIFTHNFPNGDKIAIVLLDTQGIFDDRSSLHDCTAIFALSMMSSSVQCYNLMQNIGEDHLQHLQLFTEYGRLALEQTNVTPFQKLLFIVRDWPFAYETPYGNGPTIIDEILNGNDEQTTEMRDLRRQIALNFEQVGAFLMPNPGPIVAFNQNFTGNLQDIAPDFIKYLKELVPMLFAPENLVIKRINGQKVRARDLVQYLQAYTNVFNEGVLPQPKSVLMATAEASNTILSDECLQYYSDTMEKSIDEIEPHLKEDELRILHEKTKNETVTQFLEKPKLGGDELKASFRNKVENGTEQRFINFRAQNERKFNAFVEKANLHNGRISDEINELTRRKIMQEIENSNSELSYPHLNGAFESAKQTALQKFDSRKMRDSVISKGTSEKLQRDLDDLQRALNDVLNVYGHCLQLYSNEMLKHLNEVEYFSQDDFLTLHHHSKNGAIRQFQSSSSNNGFKVIVEPKLNANIEQKLSTFQRSNDVKRQNFLQRANLHSDAISRDIKASFENKMRSEIQSKTTSEVGAFQLGSHFFYSDFIELFMQMKQNSLQEFASRKMGNDELSKQAYNNFRVKLERDLDGMQSMLNQLREISNDADARRHLRFWDRICYRKAHEEKCYYD